MGFGWFDFGFTILFPIFFTIVFVIIIATFIATIAGNIKQWKKDENSPRLTVEATVIAKRTNVTHHRGTDHHHSTSRTDYFVTFEVPSGDRMELEMEGHEFGLLLEGDHGQLTFQGSRYLEFRRN